MPSSVLKMFTLLVLVVFAAYGHHSPDHDHGDINGNQQDDNKEYLDERTFTIPPPITFNPTPITATLPTQRPIQITATLPTQRPTGRPVVTAPGPVITASIPPAIIALPDPPPPPTVSPNLVCGRRGRCYQWFDEEWQLSLDGYTQCNAGDVRRARRYCCTP